MNARVSPFLAMLESVWQRIPAMGRVIAQAGGIGEGTAIYLDAFGNKLNPETLPADARSALEDYLLVQYDLTAGKGYLYDTGFLDVPETQTLDRDQMPAAPALQPGRYAIIPNPDEVPPSPA